MIMGCLLSFPMHSLESKGPPQASQHSREVRIIGTKTCGSLYNAYTSSPVCPEQNFQDYKAYSLTLLQGKTERIQPFTMRMGTSSGHWKHGFQVEGKLLSRICGYVSYVQKKMSL